MRSNARGRVFRHPAAIFMAADAGGHTAKQHADRCGAGCVLFRALPSLSKQDAVRRVPHPNRQRLLKGLTHVRPFTPARSLGLDFRHVDRASSKCGTRAHISRGGKRRRCFEFADRLLRARRTPDLLRTSEKSSCCGSRATAGGGCGCN